MIRKLFHGLSEAIFAVDFRCETRSWGFVYPRRDAPRKMAGNSLWRDGVFASVVVKFASLVSDVFG